MTRKCELCGDTFEVSSNRPQRFCGPKCRRRNNARLFREKNPDYYRERNRALAALKPPRTLSCPRCNSTFVASGSTSKYCSVDCRNAAYRRGTVCKACGESFFENNRGRSICNSCRNAKCKAPGCEVSPAETSVRFKLGYCNPHYLRFKSHGDPLAGNKSPSVAKALDHSDGTRTCSKCNERKPLSGYYKDKLATKGHRSYCKECQKNVVTENYQKDPEKKKRYQRQHRIENIKAVRAADSERYERDKDKRITLAEAHGHIRRARRASVPFEPGITKIALRKRDGDDCAYCGQLMVFRRATNREFRDNDATIEHKVPLARGGKHVWSNVVLACRECNLSKNQKTESEFLEYRKALEQAQKKNN